jgi:L,D-peptidoglycan transpeptidase YkuD (ErfK/YbiS/YcfS/YnhG family)
MGQRKKKIILQWEFQTAAEDCEWAGCASNADMIDRRTVCLLLLGYGAAVDSLAADAPRAEVKDNVPELRASGQLIVVTTESWDAVFGELRRFERVDGQWKAVGMPMRANVGKKGMGWGIGLHGTFPEGGERKREGDKRAPAGVFSLDELFGSATAEESGITRFGYRQMTTSFVGVDDSVSVYYNRIVDSARVQRDWKSAEEMLSTDGTYRWGAVIRHNWEQLPGSGSCIFLHIWKGEGIGTSGCTALAPANVETVLRWLDATKNPLLVQLPRAEYERRKQAWGLP